MTLSERIVRYRAKHGMSQQEFADHVGISKQTVYCIENGLQDPSKVTNAKIEMALEEDEKEKA